MTIYYVVAGCREGHWFTSALPIPLCFPPVWLELHMIPVLTLIQRLSQVGDLCKRLDYRTLSQFFEAIDRFMPHILTSSPRQRLGLPALPPNIRDVLALSLALSYEDVDSLWAKTGDLLWPNSDTPHDAIDGPELDDLLGRTAPQYGLGT